MLLLLGCSWLVIGCGKANKVSEATSAKTNAAQVISIGVLNSVNTNERDAICRLFVTNGVMCGLEGTVMFDLMIKRTDLERARKIWETNIHPNIDFRSIWDKH